MVRGTTSRTIFLDSSVNHVNNDRIRFFVPPISFSAKNEEKMSLTLLQFGMYRGWTNINLTNNIGYFSFDGTLYPITITPKNYTEDTDSATSFKAALEAALTTIASDLALTGIINGFTVTYDTQTKKYKIAVDVDSAHTSKVILFRFFLAKEGTLPTNVTPEGAFSDFFQVMGGLPITNLSDLTTNSLLAVNSANPFEFESYKPSTLDTLHAIFIELNALETGNYNSTSLSDNVQNELRLIESSLFARIPATYDPLKNTIEFIDSNDMFQSFPMRRDLSIIDFRVRDSKGRSLSKLDPVQGEKGIMNWQMVLRFDIFKPPLKPTPAPSKKMTPGNLPDF